MRPATVSRTFPRWLVTCQDLLSGRKTQGTMAGTLLFGSQAPTRSYLRRHTGYVEQFGGWPPHRTVPHRITPYRTASHRTAPLH
jgi:hypothetical protein